VVDRPVAVLVGLRQARGCVLDLVGVEFAVTVGIECVSEAVAAARGRRAVAARWRLGKRRRERRAEERDRDHAESDAVSHGGIS
jgi:hypothetical protein